METVAHSTEARAASRLKAIEKIYPWVDPFYYLVDFSPLGILKFPTQGLRKFVPVALGNPGMPTYDALREVETRGLRLACEDEGILFAGRNFGLPETGEILVAGSTGSMDGARYGSCIRRDPHIRARQLCLWHMSNRLGKDTLILAVEP